MTEKKSLIEQAFDVCIFAPVGLAITVTEELPQLIDKGRARVTSQVSLARMVGSFAVAYGQREAERVVRQATGRPLQPVPSPGPGGRHNGTAGPAGRPDGPSGPSVASTPDDEPDEFEPTAGESATASLDGNSATPHADARAGTFVASPPTHSPRAGDSGSLAIPGYDALSASQVVQRLAGLAPDELEAVRSYEAATRGRRTILNRVSQLQADGGS
jgi:hypothetical protein